jgi:hypothetical protein
MRDSASFRDRSGHIFYEGLDVFRTIDFSYKNNYEILMGSGLYQLLTSKGLLIAHTEIPNITPNYKVIKPYKIDFISYPYEWTFEQLRDAALLTLEIQLLSLKYGMCLKDASAYNIQFINGRPIFIDTLSFEKYEMGHTWVAFGQFTKHFLGPLVLMKYTSNEMGKLLKNYIDGIPVNIVSQLLPLSSYFNINVLLSIHLQAKYIKRTELNSKKISQPSISIKRLENMLNQLIQYISGMKKNTKSHWSNYYETNTYLESEEESKKNIIENAIQIFQPTTVWDLGCNTGAYSVLASENGSNVIAFDADHDSVASLYQYANKKNKKILPLLMDFANPSSSIGWSEKERKSLLERGPADMVLALALVHHLRFTAGIPLDEIAKWLSRVTSKWLIIEFVPKEDSQTMRLLQNRSDIFFDYTIKNFEKIFNSQFKLFSKNLITTTGRVIYTYEK